MPFPIFSNPPLKQENSGSSWGQLCAVHPYEQIIWIISVPEQLYWQKTPDCVKAKYCYKWKSSIRQLHQSTETLQRQWSDCGKSYLLHNAPLKWSAPNLVAFEGHWSSHSKLQYINTSLGRTVYGIWGTDTISSSKQLYFLCCLRQPSLP